MSYPAGSERGFVALFFVLVLSSALTMLVFGLTYKAEYMFSLLENFRKTQGARSAALYCKERLFNNVLHNMDYVPQLGETVVTPGNSTCEYESFSREFLPTGFNAVHTNTAYIKGQNSKFTFAIRYTYSITRDLFDYIKNENVTQIN